MSSITKSHDKKLISSNNENASPCYVEKAGLRFEGIIQNWKHDL